MLERLLNLIDRRKDEQDGETHRTAFNPCPAPIQELSSLSFAPPDIVDGEVSEESLYEWLADVEAAYHDHEVDQCVRLIEEQRLLLEELDEARRERQALPRVSYRFSRRFLGLDAGPVVVRDCD
jgi:hypothetical protein